MKPSLRHRPRVLVFAKEPFPGRVKTRLGRGIGQVQAASWYRRQVAGLLRRLGADPRWETWVAVSPDAAGLKSRFWPKGVRRWPQGTGDLGQRMGRAFKRFPPGRLVIVGADIPGVQSRHIAEAFAALNSAEAVIGPATDGGYWLIGLRRGCRAAPPGLFDNVRWSTEFALSDTLANLARPGASFGRGSGAGALISTLPDIDRAEDLPYAQRARFF